MRNALHGLILVLFSAGLAQKSSAQDKINWFPLGAPIRVTAPDMIINGITDKKDKIYDFIDPDVYHEGDETNVQKTVLSFVAQPRWFWESTLPKNLEDLQLTNHGSSLSFDIAPATNGLLRFTLKVHSEERDLWREVEHRHTNLTPFLFAFWADGRPVPEPKQTDSGFMGGVNWIKQLASKGQVYECDMLVDSATILALVPGGRLRELAVVAAFGEAQHETASLVLSGDRKFHHWPPFNSKEYELPPIFVRSGKVALHYTNEQWDVVKSR